MANENQKGTEPFSVKLILAETLAFCAVNQSYLYDSLKYLCLGVLAIDLFTAFGIGTFGLVFVGAWIGNIYIDTLLAVKCHRMFLLKEPAGTIKGDLIWKKRDTSFIIYGIMLGLVVGVLALPVVFFSIQTLQPETAGSRIGYYTQVFMIPIGYISARLSLAFPAIAIDKNIDLSKSWKMSKGNGWKLFFLIYLLPWGLHFIFGKIVSGHMVLKWIYSVIGVVIFVFEVLILSNAYRHLSRIIKSPVSPGNDREAYPL